jgi:hypothetical protein
MTAAEWAQGNNAAHYLGSAPWFAWLASRETDPAGPDYFKLAKPWGLVIDRAVPDWAGPETQIVERMIARVGAMTLEEGRALAAARRSRGLDLRKGWITASRPLPADPRMAGIAGRTRAWEVLREAGARDDEENDLSMMVDDSISAVVLGGDAKVQARILAPWTKVFGSPWPDGSPRRPPILPWWRKVLPGQRDA